MGCAPGTGAARFATPSCLQCNRKPGHVLVACYAGCAGAAFARKALESLDDCIVGEPSSSAGSPWSVSWSVHTGRWRWSLRAQLRPMHLRFPHQIERSGCCKLAAVPSKPARCPVFGGQAAHDRRDLRLELQTIVRALGDLLATQEGSGAGGVCRIKDSLDLPRPATRASGAAGRWRVTGHYSPSEH